MTNLEHLAMRLKELGGDSASLLALADMACTLIEQQEQEEQEEGGKSE